MPCKVFATTDDQAERTSIEQWLVSERQQLVCQFKPDTATAHLQWVARFAPHRRPPDYPIPQARERMLRYNAIEAWQTMLKQAGDAALRLSDEPPRLGIHGQRRQPFTLSA